MTKFVKKDEINSKWYEIDAKNAVVGRLATIITKILRGKNTNLPPLRSLMELSNRQLPQSLFSTRNYWAIEISKFLYNVKEAWSICSPGPKVEDRTIFLM